MKNIKINVRFNEQDLKKIDELIDYYNNLNYTKTSLSHLVKLAILKKYNQDKQMNINNAIDSISKNILIEKVENIKNEISINQKNSLEQLKILEKNILNLLLKIKNNNLKFEFKNNDFDNELSKKINF